MPGVTRQHQSRQYDDGGDGDREPRHRGFKGKRLLERLGLYRTDSEAELDGLLAALPLADWLRVTVTPLEAHPNDPATASR